LTTKQIRKQSIKTLESMRADAVERITPAQEAIAQNEKFIKELQEANAAQKRAIIGEESFLERLDSVLAEKLGSAGVTILAPAVLA